MTTARTRRWLAGAVITTLLGGLLTLMGAAPAQANHGDLTLEVYREVSNVTSGQSVQLTARLQTAQGTPTIDGSGNGAKIDFEIIGGGTADGEGGVDSPFTPDRTCTTSTASVAAPYPECSVSILTGTAGTILVRVWVDEDDNNATAEADSTEGRLSSEDTDCNTEAQPPTSNTGREEACLDAAPDAGGTQEPDNTDVVQITVRNPVATAKKLDCAAATPVPAENGASAFVPCRVTDSDGRNLPGIQVDGENLSSIHNPDVGDDRNPADYNGAPTEENPACVSGPSGICNVRITALSTQLGLARVCFWVDSDPTVDGTNTVAAPLGDPSYDSGGNVRDGGDCDVEIDPDAAEDDDLTDTEYVDFQTAALTSIDVEPESSVGTVGTPHTLTARLFDQFARQWKTATTVGIEFLAGSVQDTDGSTPAPGLVDRSCTTPGGAAADPGTCTFTYSSSSPGTDTICGFFGTTTATCGGETLSGSNVLNADLVTRRWVAAAATTTTTAPAGGGGGGSGSSAQGYSLVGEDGSLYAYGTAKNVGDMKGKALNAPIIGVAYTPGGNGYWLVAKDGGIFTFGNADFYGSMGGEKLNSPVIGMAATPTGKGYWLFAGDGGIFTFGDAVFFGSMGDQKLNAPVINMEPLESGNGYWLVAADGGIFTFGQAVFFGSMGDQKINQPVFDMTSTDTDKGYWLVARDGGVFSFGDAEAKFYGNPVNETNPKPSRIIGMDSTPGSLGYWIADANGKVYAYGNAQQLGDRFGAANPAPMIGFASVPGLKL